MTAPSRINGHEEALDQAPNLSYSRINRYLTCPEQYRLYYLEKLRPKVCADDESLYLCNVKSSPRYRSKRSALVYRCG